MANDRSRSTLTLAMAQVVPEAGGSGSEPSRGRPDTDVGDRVRFSLASVFLPDPEALVVSLSLTSDLEGTIVDFSDSGTTPRAFAIVEIVLKSKVVVPVAKLRRAEE